MSNMSGHKEVDKRYGTGTRTEVKTIYSTYEYMTRLTSFAFSISFVSIFLFQILNIKKCTEQNCRFYFTEEEKNQKRILSSTHSAYPSKAGNVIYKVAAYQLYYDFRMKVKEKSMHDPCNWTILRFSSHTYFQQNISFQAM